MLLLSCLHSSFEAKSLLPARLAGKFRPPTATCRPAGRRVAAAALLIQCLAFLMLLLLAMT